MRAHRLTGRNVIMEFDFLLVQVSRVHGDRENAKCFSYERGENFQVEMIEVQLEMSFLRRGNLNCVGFAETQFKRETWF